MKGLGRKTAVDALCRGCIRVFDLEPWVLKSFEGGWTLVGVDCEEARDEIDEEEVVSADAVGEGGWA